MESDRRSSPETNEGGEVITLHQLRYWYGRKQDKREHTNTNITLPHRRVSEATQHCAETRDSPSQDPRDHTEQAIRHDNSKWWDTEESGGKKDLGWEVMTSNLYKGAQGTLRIRSVVLFQSSSSWWHHSVLRSQQYGNYHEIAALAAIQQPALLVFVGDHRQTPGGLFFFSSRSADVALRLGPYMRVSS